MGDKSPWATPADVAAWLQISEQQLAGLRKRKTGPRYTKVDRITVRYLWADVHSWASARRAANS